MEVKLNQQSYTFHLASRLEQGSPGDYLSGEIILPPHHHEDRLTLSLSCVREHHDAPHPCYLHPLLFTLEGKRRKENGKIIDLDLKLNEKDLIEAFIDESQQIGINLMVENGKIFIVTDKNEKIETYSKVENGKILLEDKKPLRLGVIQPVTKSLQKARKAICKEVLSKLRLKVRCEGVNQATVGFSRLVLKGSQDGRKRKREEQKPIGPTVIDDNFGGFPVTLVGSYINSKPAPTATNAHRDSLSHISLAEIPLKVLDPKVVSSVLNGTASVMGEESNDAGALSLKENLEGPTFEDLKDYEECDWVMVPPKELPIYFLSEILADQNITDFNMEHILHTIRLTATFHDAVYETFGDSWRSGTPITELVPKTPERLILHKFGGNKLHDPGFEIVKERQRNGEILQYLPASISESELRRQVEKSTLSRTLLYNREKALCMNYVVIVGRRGPIVWRMR